MKFGLSDKTIEAINSVLSKHSAVKKAIIYGSRAKGNYKNGSDIDLTLVGDGISYNELGTIDFELDDLLLPYTIDLSILCLISDADVVDHIRRIGRPFYERRAQDEVTENH